MVHINPLTVCRYFLFIRKNLFPTLLRNDAVDAPYIFKSLNLKLPDFLRQALNTLLIPLGNFADFLNGIVDLHGA